MISKTILPGRKGPIAVKILLYAAGLLFLLWRAPYGFCFNDEPFCITLAHRLWQGDGLIVDEWNGAQNFGGVLLPFYFVYRLFCSSNEGILLTFRYVYCLLWWGTCVLTERRLSVDFRGSWVVFLYLLLFSPLDNMTLSYTSMGLMCALLLCLQLWGLPERDGKADMLQAAVFSALWVVLVLCSPAMAVLYGLLLLIALLGTAWEKKQQRGFWFRNLRKIYSRSVWMVAAAAAGYLLALVFFRGSLERVLENFPQIFASPGHNSFSLCNSVIWLHKKLLEQTHFLYGSAVLAAAVGCWKPAKCFRLPVFLLCAVCWLYHLVSYLLGEMMSLFNYQMLYIALLGAAAFALLNQRPWKLFLIFYGGGGAYAILNGIMSDTGLQGASAALSISGCAGILFLVLLVQELVREFEQRKFLRGLAVCCLCGVLAVQLSAEFGIRMYRQYWDWSLPGLNKTISCGAAKGLKTSPENAQMYEELCGKLTYLLAQTSTQGKRFLSTTHGPYLYLDADLPYATFSSWSFAYRESGFQERLVQYQQINPGKEPELVFCAAAEDILPLVQKGYHAIEYQGAYLFVRQAPDS